MGRGEVSKGHRGHPREQAVTTTSLERDCDQAGHPLVEPRTPRKGTSKERSERYRCRPRPIHVVRRSLCSAARRCADNS
jgi:hypothetical protein